MDLERKKINNKIFIIGVDGMDPRATEHYLAQGKMPNTKKLLEQGAANEHLEMIGGHPTGTPPMWTTLATVECICRKRNENFGVALARICLASN